jgi:type I restriction enzyme R subunit
MVLRELEQMNDYDLYDVLAEIGYGAAARTREERAAAFAYKNATWLSTMPVDTSATIRAIASQFAWGGTDGLESAYMFQTPEVQRAGGLSALRSYGAPAEILFQTKERMFAA